jgi:cyclopropane-fatty-acyl-phospholipid synthase
MNGLDQALQARFAPPRARPARATRLALELLDSLHGGALAVELPQGEALCAGSGPVVAQLKVHHEHCFSETLARGDIGFGESYIDGLWDSDRLAALLGPRPFRSFVVREGRADRHAAGAYRCSGRAGGSAGSRERKAA